MASANQTPLRASFSEPISLFTSIVLHLGEDRGPSAPSRTAAYHEAHTEFSDLKNALRCQLGTLATVAQSAAKEALALTERIGGLAFDSNGALPSNNLRTPEAAAHDDYCARRSNNSSTLRSTDPCYTAGLAKRTEQFATLIFDTDRTRRRGPTGEGVEHVIKRKNRQLWDLFDEKESFRLELETVKARESEVDGRERERTSESLRLSQENSRLVDSKKTLEDELSKTRIEADAWRSLADNVQEMQEMAIAAFERCNALERENIELREAMHAFAEGSTSFTIQQLQKIMTSLTEEVAAFKKREGVLKEKESTMRDKENNSIIKAMRKQTRELKRRSLQSKNIENTVLTMVDAGTNKHTGALPPIPSFSELFLI
ncbi:hypothetical protein BC835DRAFT_1412501 [Cytidiella melzeri]|nr:hypothetical protein BC835DRAFT_1412501 [Cytidiella melzeri]